MNSNEDESAALIGRRLEELEATMPALQYCVALLVKNVKKNYTFPSSSLLENMAVVAEGSNFSFA